MWHSVQALASPEAGGPSSGSSAPLPCCVGRRTKQTARLINTRTNPASGTQIERGDRGSELTFSTEESISGDRTDGSTTAEPLPSSSVSSLVESSAEPSDARRHSPCVDLAAGRRGGSGANERAAGEVGAFDEGVHRRQARHHPRRAPVDPGTAERWRRETLGRRCRLARGRPASRRAEVGHCACSAGIGGIRGEERGRERGQGDRPREAERGGREQREREEGGGGGGGHRRATREGDRRRAEVQAPSRCARAAALSVSGDREGGEEK